MNAPKFRDDIDPSKTWVISDTHFGHQNIIEFCHRPSDHESIMLEEIAQAVPDDPSVTLLHLGDLCYKGNAYFQHITSKHLPQQPRKLLIAGNHDRGRYSFYKKCGFKLARPFWIKWGDTWTVSFSHYPWGPDEEGGPMPDFHLRVHGHIHNNGYTRSAFVPFLRDHVNLSVEQTKFKPVNLGLLLSSVIDGNYPADKELPDADTVEKENPHVAA